MSGLRELMSTRMGIVIVAETGVSLLGLIFNFVDILGVSFSKGFLGFLYWSSFFISGFLLAFSLFNLRDTIRSKVPSFDLIELGYIGIWTIFYGLAVVLSFLGFALSSIFGFSLLPIFIYHFYLAYSKYKTGETGSSLENPPAAAPTF